MNEIIKKQKIDIRNRIKHQKQLMSESEIESASQRICSQISGWKPFINSPIILTYIPFRAEVNLIPLIKDYSTKIWLIPRINTADYSMTFHAYDPDHLVLHKLGMFEPAENSEKFQSKLVTLALVPGLAFDLQGGRLGYGGGYYDRFLAGFTGISLGITYQSCLQDFIPRDDFDIPVQFVVTENKLYQIENNPVNR